MLIRERPQGEFTRQLLLGENLDVDKIEADYENGVLTLAIPVAEKSQVEADLGRKLRRTPDNRGRVPPLGSVR